jgi:hypothetical protein
MSQHEPLLMHYQFQLGAFMLNGSQLQAAYHCVLLLDQKNFHCILLLIYQLLIHLLHVIS